MFGAGTVQWAWGLDNTNAWAHHATDPSGNPPDPNMQQATVNLLADMGDPAGDADQRAGRRRRSRPTRLRRPRRSRSPAPNANLQDGSQITISGTATDAGGGVVAGVEVSTDGGSTWHPATSLRTARPSLDLHLDRRRLPDADDRDPRGRRQRQPRDASDATSVNVAAHARSGATP